jgi:hypothetical protein
MEREYGEAYSPLGWHASPQTIQTGEWSDDTLALRMKMTERRGHAPHATRGGTISLTTSPGTLVRLTFLV